MKKIVLAFFIFHFAFLISAAPAFAHVVVRPNEVGVGAFQTFTVGVPVEKDIPTTGLRLVIPDGLQHVTPNVKPGWEINVKKTGEGEEAKVTEITWTAGTIPAGQRDEFLFSAQVPTAESTVIWKAYQTYEDGTVVAWDHDPKASEHSHESSDGGPWSETAIVNDLAAKTTERVVTEKNTFNDKLPLILSIAALLLAGTSLYRQSRLKK